MKLVPAEFEAFALGRKDAQLTSKELPKRRHFADADAPW